MKREDSDKRIFLEEVDAAVREITAGINPMGWAFCCCNLGPAMSPLNQHGQRMQRWGQCVGLYFISRVMQNAYAG